MSDGFFESTEGDWFLSNLSDNDTMNRYNNPSVAGPMENPPKYSIDCMYVRVQHRLYMCGACGEKVPEKNLTEHHLNMHSEVPFIMDMYELFEIDEQFQCVWCNVDTLESDFQTHLEQSHPEVLADSANQNITSSHGSEYSLDTNLDANQQSTSDTATIRQYFCKACTATGISESNLRRHHALKHNNIPATVNLFEVGKVFTKIKCDVCNKMIKEDRMEKHRLKYHPDKYGETKSETPDGMQTPPDGFHNVCISTHELCRLRSQNRIYEVNGRLHLRDSS